MESFSKSKLVLHRLISWYPLNRKTKKKIAKKSHTQRKQLLMDENTSLHLVMSAFCWHGDEESKKRDLFGDGGGCGSVDRMHRYRSQIWKNLRLNHKSLCLISI